MDHIDLSKYFVEAKGYKTGRQRCDSEKLLKGKTFWVGAKLTLEEVYRNNNLYESMEFSWVDEFGKPKIQDITNISWSDYWLPGEPSYYCYDDYGTYIEEGYISMFYGDNGNRFYLNDMNNNVISIVNSYSGNIGYICEYE